MFTRREFICGATAATMSTPAFMAALTKNASAASNTILVVYELNGGNDAFNMIVPWDTTGFATYNAQRGNIAISSGSIISAGSVFDVTPTGTGTPFAFNPTMSSTTATNNLRSLYGLGKVAVVMGLGLPPNAYSRDGHQQAQFYWQTAGINNLGETNVGWAGLAFDQISTTGNALPPMVALDGSSQIAFTGSKNAPLVIGGDIGGFSPSITGHSTATTTTSITARPESIRG